MPSSACLAGENPSEPSIADRLTAVERQVAILMQKYREEQEASDAETAAYMAAARRDRLSD